MEEKKELHIGGIIKKVMTEKNYGETRLANEMHLHVTSISRFYRQESMQISQLKLISEIVNYDFFAECSARLSLKNGDAMAIKVDAGVKQTECEKLLAEKILELEKKEQEMEFLKKELGYVKEINELLKRKRG